MSITNGKYIVLLSGGLDSAVLAYHLKHSGNQIKGLTVLYGQRHAREKHAARALAHGLKIEHTVLDVSAVKSILGNSCSLLNQDIAVPEGHYTDKSMQTTVVPNRNMLLLSLATSFSIASGMDGIAYAAHAGDHVIYPDCRTEFADALATAIQLADFSCQQLIRPFITMSKSEIVTLGHQLAVPFALTWSCYNGQDLHCGRCGTCVERREAFALAAVPDPTIYERMFV